MNYFKNILLVSLFIFFSATQDTFGQWKYENSTISEQDVIIEYSVNYQKTLSESQKKSSNYCSEIIVILNEDKLIEKRFHKPGFYKRFYQYDYKKNKIYNCYLKSKKGLYSEFEEPTKEAVLQEGFEKKIANITCDKYISTVNGEPVEIYTTKEFGLRYVKDFNLQGLLMEYTMYDKYLGYYTVKAQKVSFLKLPANVYSLDKYNLISEQEYNESIEKSKQEKIKLKAKKIGQKSTRFSVRTIENKKKSSKKIMEENKILVLNFWFKNCPPCRAEIPKLNELEKQYADNPNVEFVAIGLDDKYTILEFLKTNPLMYDIIDDGRWLAKKFKITSYPTNIIVDQKGITQFFEIGYKSNIKSIMTNKIDELLEDNE